MIVMDLQFFGGRGSSAGRTFSPPNEGDDDNFSPYSLSEQLPDTVKEAIGTKGKEKTISDAMKKSNPNFSRDYSEFSENCQRCVVAYEMRRRGYDVEAQPTYSGDIWPQVISVNGQRLGRWRGAFRGAKTIDVGGNRTEKVLSNISKQMREFGNGSRGVINIVYKGKHVGHVFNVENRGGQMYYVDAQDGSRYSAADIRNFMSIVDTKSVGLTRTDNLRVSDRMKNFVWRADRGKKK